MKRFIKWQEEIYGKPEEEKEALTEDKDTPADEPVTECTNMQEVEALVKKAVGFNDSKKAVKLVKTLKDSKFFGSLGSDEKKKAMNPFLKKYPELWAKRGQNEGVDPVSILIEEAGEVSEFEELIKKAIALKNHMKAMALLVPWAKKHQDFKKKFHEEWLKSMRMFTKAYPTIAKKNEGVNPTDIDSAGSDQDLDNVGIPYDLDTAEKLASGDRGQDETERDYQLQIFQLMLKSTPKDDPNDVDPTKGPQGHTDGGIGTDGIINQTIRNYLEKEYANRDKGFKEVEKMRNKIPVKTTSTAFRQDDKTPRNDINPEGGNADQHTNIIDKE